MKVSLLYTDKSVIQPAILLLQSLLHKAPLWETTSVITVYLGRISLAQNQGC